MGSGAVCASIPIWSHRPVIKLGLTQRLKKDAAEEGRGRSRRTQIGRETGQQPLPSASPSAASRPLVNNITDSLILTCEH